MIVGDDLGEHRQCDLAGPFPADVQTSRNMEAAKRSIVIPARQIGVGRSRTWLAAHHRDIASFAVEQQRQDRVTVGCVVITQHYRVCNGQPSRTKIIKSRRVEEQRCPTSDDGRQIEQRPRDRVVGHNEDPPVRRPLVGPRLTCRCRAHSLHHAAHPSGALQVRRCA